MFVYIYKNTTHSTMILKYVWCNNAVKTFKTKGKGERVRVSGVKVREKEKVSITHEHICGVV